MAHGTPGPRGAVQAPRVQTDGQGDGAVASLAERGWLDGEQLSTDGAARREAIETKTDELAMAPWQHLGAEATERLVELVRPLSRAITESGAFGKGPKL